MGVSLIAYRVGVAATRTGFPQFRLPSFPQIKFARAKRSRLGVFSRGGGCRGSMGVSTDVHMKDKIELSELEKKIFNRLLDVVRHFNLDTQLRVAGGWVRDKLLGKDCYDIDIALDNMLGREFCEKVNEYLSYTGEEQQGVGVIQCNPDQSKHLETARMRILDTWVDFVNLRSESYVENSRIPTMKFGTAEEDACRRDLTINSLFYNINTDLVEDLTGRGISDLQSGLIVTPLPPKLTFLDDPLRVLRAIRFGARFEFKLDKDLKEAASDEEVKVALADKISRERIGHEINLMISCHHPVAAIISICDLELFWIIFRLPHNHEPEITEGADRLCLRYIDAAWNIMQSVGLSSLNDEYRRIGLYGALFLPLKDILYADKKDKKFPVVNHIIRYSLKLKARDADMVMSLHDASEKFISLIPFIISSEEFSSYETELEDEYRDFPLPSRKRIMAGLVLWQIKGLWRTALLLSTLLYPNLSQTDDFLEMQQEFHKRVELFKRVENVIIELGLEKVWETKPLLDGRAIMSALHLKAGGPQVKEWQEKMFKWHFAHPSGTPDECIDWIKQSSSKRLKLTDNGDGTSDLTHS